MRHLLQIFLLVTGSMLILYALFLAARINFSLGVILPFFAGLPLLGGGIFYNRLLAENCRGVWCLARIAFIAGYGLAILVFAAACFLMAGQLKKEPDPGANALVVLGAGLYGDQVSATLASRLDTAFNIWQQDPEIPVVVCGGQGPDELIPEARAMSAYLEQKGIPREKILIEDLSTSTRENLGYARDHLDHYLKGNLNYTTSGDQPGIIVVTSNYHLYRAVKIAEQVGFKATGIGSPTLWYLLPADLMRETLAIARLYILGY